MLYHFSENNNIDVFYPRETTNRLNFSHVVCAIDEEHEFSFYFPRACPRIVLYKTETISDEHNSLFFNNISGNKLVFIEQEWFNAVNNQTIYRYQFDDPSFELYDEIAGYYISPNVIKPVRMDTYSNLVERLLLNKGVQLVLQNNLYPLRNAILESGFKDFGIHNFANARKL